MVDRKVGTLSIVAVLLGACVQSPAGAVLGSTASSFPASASTVAPDEVEGVSLGAPTKEAAAGIDGCGVAKYASQIQGIGILAHATLLPQYVPITGREPEIQSDDRTFVVLFSGSIRLPLRGGQGAPSFLDIENATCAMLQGHPTWYMTGAWTDSTGKTGTPEPAALMDKNLPAPLP